MTSSGNALPATVDDTTTEKPRRRRSGGNAAETRPAAGWQDRYPRAITGLSNPRPPAVPATLQLSLEEYYAACSLIGLLGSQGSEPNQEWAAEWACKMGALMAKKCRKKWHP